MNRRGFIAALIVAGATPDAWAQTPGRVYRIAIVSVGQPVAQMTGTAADSQTRSLLDELRRLGYVEGHNLVVEPYSAEGRGHYAELAEEVVRSKPDLIFAWTTYLTAQFKSATATIPIVAYMSDPLGNGIVASLARPGGNITGVTSNAGAEIAGKRLEILLEAIPKISRLGFLAPRVRWDDSNGREMQESARRLGISLLGPPLDSPIDEAEVRRVFSALTQQGAEAIEVDEAGENWQHRQLIVNLAAKDRLPTIYPYREMVDLGGFMSYATDLTAMGRHVARQIDEILRGARPAEIPIYQPTEFNLIINLKAAKALGLEIPGSLLARADEVIE
jgi:putative ABC transport system substrate-binding protein